MPRFEGGTSGLRGGRAHYRTRRSRVTAEIDGIEEIQAYLLSLPYAVMNQMGTKMVEALVLVQRTLGQSILRKFTQHTGRFRKSWDMQMITKPVAGKGQLGGGIVAGKVGSNHPAAWIQNVGSGYLPGGVVRPRQAGSLAIPQTKTARGSRARDWGDRLELQQGSRGAYLAEKASGTVQYILKRSVRLKPTGYLDESVNTAEPLVVNLLGYGVGIAVMEGPRP